MKTSSQTLYLIGLALSMASIVSNRFNLMPESLSCFVMGFGFSLLVVAAIDYRCSLSKLKS